ncbi:MAG TPA: hypothetical protein VGM34_00950 [Chlamydiales bacterium]|jgi:hypothetical protein
MSALALGIGVPPAIPLMAGAFCCVTAINIYSESQAPYFSTQANKSTTLKAIQTIWLLSTLYFASLSVLYALSLFEAALPYTVAALAPWTLGAFVSELGLQFIVFKIHTIKSTCTDESVNELVSIYLAQSIASLKSLGAFFLLAAASHQLN